MAYSKKIGIPQYVPKGDIVDLNDTIDTGYFRTLINEIENALKNNEITEREAHYLRLAASRWIKFDYNKVAEYFCSEKCSAKMQELLQRSTMVMVDVDDALAYGLVNCKNFVEELRQQGKQEHPEKTYEISGKVKENFNLFADSTQE